MKKILLPHQFYFPYLDVARDRVTKEKLDVFKASLAHSTRTRSLIYVHLPFCNSECSFCGFDKAYDLGGISPYIAALTSEIDYYAETPYAQGLKITGIHIGGGTPSILPEETLGSLIDTVRNRFRAARVPLNIECSPITLTDGMIDMLREKRISRVSVGVQTFDPLLRRYLNIRSSLNETYVALTRLKEAGIVTFVDIMYGFPDVGTGDQMARVLSDIREAIEIEVEGIDFSQYYPFHNPLSQRIREEALEFPTSEEMVTMILSASALMESEGYRQSTEYLFCRRGDILLEKAYFGASDCIAIGSGSLGLINGYKYKNSRYARYLKSETPAILSIRKLTGDELERIPIVGFPRLLRMPKDILSEQMKSRYREKLTKFIDVQLLEETPEEYLLTTKGKAFINNMYFMMMEKEEQQEVEEKLKILKLA